MTKELESILLLGESDVGKTHFGAQLLRRLNVSAGQLRMSGAAASIEPFEAALEKLSQGFAADHTPHAVYADSVWPVQSLSGQAANLVWPDYGGEQISKDIVANKRLNDNWRRRTIDSTAWLMMIRPAHAIIADDVLTRSISKSPAEQDAVASLSAQSRFIELLQMLLFIRSASTNHRKNDVPIAIVLSCFDELQVEGSPSEYFAAHLPLVNQFVRSRWPDDILMIFGLSALGRPLSPKTSDSEFASKGPEHFGYVVLPDG